MIKRLLIANRGEIAVRIIRACKELGISTVAVYSDADSDALHVELADQACRIGKAEAIDSYLNASAIIRAAERTGVDAIHPGYGFLSESEELVKLCEQHGLIFVGPGREAIRLMGSKIEAKGIAEQAGVPVLPGYHGVDQSLETLRIEADRIGYPVLIKASAGGGGRGMRRVDSATEFATELSLAKQESLAAFGDDAVLLEKYLIAPRHLEVQLAGDHHGNLIHLYERECSIQRNHQKLIEEAPAAFLTSGQRDTLCNWALEIGQAIQYDSLGTVEFIFDSVAGESYFLEMNTRLQVEHPVTECITGEDLVAWQIQIADGQVLPKMQADIACKGWAIEARINAEDPAAGYCPQTGQIRVHRAPHVTGLRIDSGIREGSVVSPYYDSMLTKLIACGDDRVQAKNRLLQGLRTYQLAGVENNLVFLQDLLEHTDFLAQPLSTDYLACIFPDGWKNTNDRLGDARLAALAGYVLSLEHQPSAVSPWQSLGGWRLTEAAGVCIIWLADSLGPPQAMSVSGRQGAYTAGLSDGVPVDLVVTMHAGRLSVESEGVVTHWTFAQSAQTVSVSSFGRTYLFTVCDTEAIHLGNDDALDAASSSLIRAPMPGLIVEVLPAVGDQVTAGQVLIVMEAMKMIQSLTASVAGTVLKVNCVPGDAVEGNVLLVEIEEFEE